MSEMGTLHVEVEVERPTRRGGMNARVRWLIPLSAVIAATSCGDGTGPTFGVTGLTIGTPLTETVSRGGAKRYSVPVTPGAAYQVSLTGLTDDVDLHHFGPNTGFSSPSLCLVSRTMVLDTESEACTAIATGSTMYIGVDASRATGSSVTYTIAVQGVPVTALTLSSPLEQSITQGESKVYTVALTPGTRYSASISGLTDSAVAFGVIEDGQSGSGRGGFSPHELQLTAQGSTMYLAVDGWGLNQSSAAFRILAAPVPVIRGPNMPTSGAIPARMAVVGWVESRQTNRYRVDGLGPGIHTVSVVGASEDVAFQVHYDATYVMQLECTLNNFDAMECPVTGPSVFFSVLAGPGNLTGAGFIMLAW